MNTKKLFLALILFTSVYHTFSQSYPEINSERPRILIPQNKFDDLKSLFDNGNNDRFNDLHGLVTSTAANSGGYNNGYDFFICGDHAATNTFKLCGDPSNWKWNFSQGGTSLNILKLVLLKYHLDIDKNLQKERIHYIANRLLDYIKQKDFTHNGQNLIVTDYGRYGDYGQGNANHEKRLRQIAEFGSILLDWGYDPLLDFSSRSQLVHELYRLSFTFMKIWVYQYQSGNNMPFPNDTFYGGHAQRNHLYNMQLVMALHGYNDTVIDNTLLNSTEQSSLLVRYQFLSDKFYNEFLPLMKSRMEGLSGENVTGEYNGGAYSIVWYSFIEYFELIHYGTNYEAINTGTIYANNTWANNFINQYSALIRPDKSVLHLGDDNLKITSGYNYEKNILSLFNHFNGNTGNQFILYKYHHENVRPYARVIEELLFKETLVPPTTGPVNPFPLNWFSKTSGHSIMKTSKEASATMISYVNKTANPNNHEHLDNNSFTIYKNGPLFVDSGTYDSFFSDHYTNYYRRTIAHNAITIHDPNEETVIEGNVLNFSNDGGQIYPAALKGYSSFQESYNPNRWIIYSKNDNLNFVYHVTDASESYNKNKVDSYIRKFLYLKNEDRVIVIDYIKKPANANNFDVRWNVHFKGKPVVYNSTGDVEGYVSRADVAGNEIEIERYLYDRKYKVGNGTGGNATIKTLFPTAADTQAKIIGSTHTDENIGCYYVYGDDDTMGTNYSPLNTVKTDGAKWRLEVSSINKTRYNVLLHTIDIGSTNDSSENESTLISNQDTSMTVGWDDNLYVFGTNYVGDNNTSHVVNISNLSAGNYNLNVFDLEPNKTYYLKIDNAPCEAVNTNSEGLFNANITFNNNSSELRILPICKIKTLFRHSDNISLDVFPNAVKSGGKLTISISNNDANIENKFRIYDLSGKLILVKNQVGNEVIIDNLNINVGVYILEMENSGEKIIKKIIVN